MYPYICLNELTFIFEKSIIWNLLVLRAHLLFTVGLHRDRMSPILLLDHLVQIFVTCRYSLLYEECINEGKRKKVQKRLASSSLSLFSLISSVSCSTEDWLRSLSVVDISFSLSSADFRATFSITCNEFLHCCCELTTSMFLNSSRQSHSVSLTHNRHRQNSTQSLAFRAPQDDTVTFFDHLLLYIQHLVSRNKNMPFTVFF